MAQPTTAQQTTNTAGRRIMRNTVVLSVGESITLVAGTLWTIIVARYIGPATYGFYSYVHATLALLVIGVNLGFDRLLTRNVAQEPGAGWSYLVTFSLIKTILSVLVLGGFLAFIAMGHESREHGNVALIIAGMWFVSNLFNLANAYLYAYEAMHYAVVGQALNSVLTLTTGAAAVWLQLPFSVVLWLSLGASVVQLVVSYLFASRLRLPARGQSARVLLPVRKVGRLVAESLPFAALVLIASANTNLPILLLRVLTLDDTSVGYLSAAVRIYSMAVIGPSMLARAIFPAMASAFAQSPKSFADIFERGYRYVTFVTMPIGIGLWAVAPYVLGLIYGRAYDPAARTTQILALVLVTGIGYATATALEAMSRQTLSAVIYGGLVILGAAVGYWAIPKYGAEGAAVSILLSASLGFFVYALVVYRLLRVRYPFAWVVKTGVASLLMGIVVWLSLSQVHFLLVSFLIAPITYMLAHLALGTLTACDREFLLQVLPAIDRPAAAIGRIRRRLFSGKA